METFLLVATVLYPPALYLLPASVSSKIDLGVKILKTVTNALDKASKTKAGFNNDIEVK
jgi:hypothetical protein